MITGWDKGMVGMCIGEKRKLTIPHTMGYGTKGTGKVSFFIRNCTYISFYIFTDKIHDLHFVFPLGYLSMYIQNKLDYT